MTYRVAIIGLGYFSQFHLQSWAADPRADIAGVTDLDAGLRNKVAADHGTRAFDDADSLISQTRPDIVDIVAPPPAHDALVRASLAPGRVVICQKPFATSLGEAEALAKAAEKAGTTLIIHENFRFQPWYRDLKAWLDTGAMGQIWQARFCLRPGDGRGPDAYLARQPAFQKMEHLLIHETAVHFLDLFTWLFGPISTVYADLRRLNPIIAGEDAGLMVTQHANGIRALFDGNRLTDHVSDQPRRTMGELEIVGDGGTATLDGAGKLWFRPFGEQTALPLPQPTPADDRVFGGGCVAALNAHVIDALTGKAAYENTASAYLPIIRATNAAYDSAASGRRIDI